MYRAEDVKWITTSKEQAICIYTYHWKGIYQGELAYGKGRATNVFVATLDGEWKLIHEHLSLG
ncbi:hypothetical protein D3C74_461540 [compost metagenome]